MAEIAKNGKPSLSTFTPSHESNYSDLIAGEDLAAGDACYYKSDGKVWRSSGAAANAAAVVDGYPPIDYKAGQAVTLYHGVVFGYGTGLTPGSFLYLSGTIAGGLADAASTGGTVPIGRVMPNGQEVLLMTSY